MFDLNPARIDGDVFAIVAHPDDVPMHARLRRLFARWRAAAPRQGLPDRAALIAEDFGDLAAELWMLEVQRTPLRLRYASCGANVVATIGRDPTGYWLDELFPDAQGTRYYERYRVMADQGVATWRKGRPAFWRGVVPMIESLMVPLAADGRTVDHFAAITVVHDDPDGAAG